MYTLQCYTLCSMCNNNINNNDNNTCGTCVQVFITKSSRLPLKAVSGGTVPVWHICVCLLR